jgi:peptidoglycan/xylan/chitin deacetylase (PgdA/CDA1 family)
VQAAESDVQAAPRRPPLDVRSALRRLGLTRGRLLASRAVAERAVLSRRRRAAPRARGRILCYHSVGTPAWGINDVPPARFRRQLESALRSGYRFVPAREIAQTGGAARELAVTFDDGLTSVATEAAPILAELRIPYTVFVVSDWADGRSRFDGGLLLGWRQLERLARDGAEIGSHSVTHGNFSRMPREQIAAELADSRAAIESRLGLRPDAFAIPNGRGRDWPAGSTEAARTAGYTMVYSACEDRRAPGPLGRTMITSWDGERLFRAALEGAYDVWEEPIP